MHSKLFWSIQLRTVLWGRGRRLLGVSFRARMRLHARRAARVGAVMSNRVWRPSLCKFIYFA